jgi:hypothetical protein
LANPKGLDLETGDSAARAAAIREILRQSMESGTIAPRRCVATLAFAVPCDTPGAFVRALFALYGLPRAAADIFVADLSFAIGSGRYDFLVSEERAVTSALDAAFTVRGCDPTTKPALRSELLALLVPPAD